jgi:hypothetical protein
MKRKNRSLPGAIENLQASRGKDTTPPVGAMKKEDAAQYYELWNQLAGLLADCTEEEMAAFDSTLRLSLHAESENVRRFERVESLQIENWLST